MVGVRGAHAGIQRNLITALTVRLRGAPCQPYGGELKIKVGERIRYPDAFVVCTPVSARTTVVEDPVVVFEILSESTANTDLVLKNEEYRDTPSIQRYVILQQTHAGAIVFSRKGEDWVSDPLHGDDAVLRMPEIGVEIPLPELYIDVELESAADPPD
jgi:Uma2 family endonuclease